MNNFSPTLRGMGAIVVPRARLCPSEFETMVTICPRNVVCAHGFSRLRVSSHPCRCCVWAHDSQDGFRFPGHSLCVLATDWISRLRRVALVSQSVSDKVTEAERN
jgi:hypothetical protein